MVDAERLLKSITDIIEINGHYQELKAAHSRVNAIESRISDKMCDLARHLKESGFDGSLLYGDAVYSFEEDTVTRVPCDTEYESHSSDRPSSIGNF